MLYDCQDAAQKIQFSADSIPIAKEFLAGIIDEEKQEDV